MNKEGLLKMACEAAGIDFSYSEFDRQNQAEVNEVQLKALYNAILERAAVEFNQPHAEYFGHEIQETIRALKTENSV